MYELSTSRYVSNTNKIYFSLSVLGAIVDMPQSTYAVSEKTLDALHRVNLHAGKYAEKARSHYPGNKPAARRNSVKKKALYQLKTTILSKLVRRGIAEATECHEIDGRDYYAISVAGEQSFHSPVDSWSGPSLDVDPNRDKRELTQFDKSSETDEAARPVS